MFPCVWAALRISVLNSSVDGMWCTRVVLFFFGHQICAHSLDNLSSGIARHLLCVARTLWYVHYTEYEEFCILLLRLWICYVDSKWVGACNNKTKRNWGQLRDRSSPTMQHPELREQSNALWKCECCGSCGRSSNLLQATGLRLPIRAVNTQHSRASWSGRFERPSAVEHVVTTDSSENPKSSCGGSMSISELGYWYSITPEHGQIAHTSSSEHI